MSSRRSFMLGAAGIAFAPLAIRAQESTPTAAESRLAQLGFPGFVVRVNGDEFELAETSVTEGRVLITLENTGEESWHGFLLRLPDDQSFESLMGATPAPGEEDLPPAWLFESTFPGFPGETEAGLTNLALVDLIPGQYVIVGDSFQPFEVIARADASPQPLADVPADAAVDVFDFNFGFPEAIAAGPQIWEVTNTGEQPHEILLARSSQPITAAQVIELFSAESEEATPIGGGPSLADIEAVGGIGWLSPGLTGWTEVNLTDGTYIALCFVPDPETFTPHVFMGMVTVFIVGDVGATPLS